MRVLVVEDHTDIADLLADVLTDEGIDVTVRRTDFLGLLIDTWEDYDVLLCDLMLPGVSGAAICAAARKAKPELRIVLLTAAQSISDGLLAVVDIALGKPASFEAIVAAVTG